jgi:class 3 adenylate cyclase
MDGDVGGIAVHIAQRVAAAAQPGEVLALRTVKDLVAGSLLAFSPRWYASAEGSLGGVGAVCR